MEKSYLLYNYNKLSIIDFVSQLRSVFCLKLLFFARLICDFLGDSMRFVTKENSSLYVSMELFEIIVYG